MRSLLGRVNLVVDFFFSFPFNTLSISCPSLWPAELLLKDQPFGDPLVFVAFPLFLLIIFSLCLILINVCPGMFLFGSTVYGTLWVSQTWMALSFPILGKFLTIISNIFSYPFFFSSSGIFIIQMVHLMLS